MHTLHYIAVKANDPEEAFEEIQSSLVSENIADWSDWHVVGGGRWSNSQYEDSKELILSYTNDKEKFIKVIEEIKEARAEAMSQYKHHFKLDHLLIEIEDFILGNGIGSQPYDMNKYFVKLACEMLGNKYNSESYFYDLSEYTSNLSYLLEKINDDSAHDYYLIPVDFHF